MEKTSWGKLPEIHILVCTNERPAGNPKGSCAGRGAVGLFEAFRREIETRGLRGRVLVNRTNCLKPCEFGPTVVVHPAGAWYGGVQPADVPEVLEAALEGRMVDRLRLPEAAHRSF